MRILVAIFVFVGGLGAMAAHKTVLLRDQAASADSGLLSRHYRGGEKLSYDMKGTYDERGSVQSYEARADGVVKKDVAGNFYEEYQWSDLSWNGHPVPIPAANAQFRQIVSLDPGAKGSFPVHPPDVRRAPPGLIGPILDFMTFYVDLGMAIRHGLGHAGDHVYVKFGRPVSWAAGEGAVLGESSIDFDITLQDVDRSTNTATLLVRHVPPSESQVQLPAEWMRTPVVDTPNNWVSVTKSASGKYVAAVGKETFDVLIRTSLTDGRILSATMDNPVEVLERECDDAALTICGAPHPVSNSAANLYPVG